MRIDRFREEHARRIRAFQRPDIPPAQRMIELDLNLNHPLELGRSSSFSNFGVMWLVSMSNSGHDHVVLLPTPWKPPAEWPVAMFDEQEGIAVTFATSIARWFPAYVVHIASNEARRPLLAANAGAIVEHCRAYFDFDAAALVDGLAENRLSTTEAYALVEPGSYVHDFHALLARDAPAADFATLARTRPSYNAPLAKLFAMGALDDDDALARETLHRNLRWDFGPRAMKMVRTIGARLAGDDAASAFAPMLERIRAGEAYFHGAEGFFAAGKSYEAANDLAHALPCYENAIFFEACESEGFHGDSLLRARAVAAKIGDESYLSYFDEVAMPEAKGDA